MNHVQTVRYTMDLDERKPLELTVMALPDGAVVAEHGGRKFVILLQGGGPL